MKGLFKIERGKASFSNTNNCIKLEFLSFLLQLWWQCLISKNPNQNIIIVIVFHQPKKGSIIIILPMHSYSHLEDDGKEKMEEERLGMEQE